MKTHFIPCLKLTLLTMVLFGVAYPLAITGIAKLIAPNGGVGKIVSVNSKAAGFELIGQSFRSRKYFHGRPSAVGYNAASTGGSNKGPVNDEYLDQVEERIADLLQQNPGVRREDIPVDLVTASGGGLDPHISPAAARVQVHRVAMERGLSEQLLNQFIDQLTERPLWGFLGTSKVNVLRLNIAIDTTR